MTILHYVMFITEGWLSKTAYLYLQQIFFCNKTVPRHLIKYIKLTDQLIERYIDEICLVEKIKMFEILKTDTEL